MQAQKFKNSQIDAIEIDYKAANETKSNFDNSPWKNRLSVLNANYEGQKFNKFYDLLLSNPPFYKNSLKSRSTSRDLARQEKFLPFQVLFRKSSTIIKKEGNFQIIIPFHYKTEILQLAEQCNFYLNRLCIVYGVPNSKPVRILCSFSKIKKLWVEEELIIEKQRGVFTESYQALTQDFYINF